MIKEKAAPAGIDIEIVVLTEEGFWTDGWMVAPFTTVFWGGRPPFEAFSVVYTSGAPWNESYWGNDRVDELLQIALGQSELEDQKQTYGELQCLVVDQVPRIIPVFRPVVLGVRNDVRDAEPMWDATMSLHRVWLDR